MENPISTKTGSSLSHVDLEIAIPRRSRTRTSAILFLAECISFAFTITQGILLVPLYLRFVTIPLYGAWLATGQVLGWLTLADPGTDVVVRQRVARALGAGEVEGIAGWIRLGLFIGIAAGTAILLISLALAAWVPGLFGLQAESAGELRTALYLGAVATALVTVSFSLAAPLQALQRAIPYSVTMIAANVGGMSASILLLFHGWGVRSIPMGWLVRSLLLVIGWGLALLHVWLRFGIGRARGPTDRLFEVLRLSAFTAVCKAGYALQNSADALLAAVILGPAFATKLVLSGRVIETLRTFPERFGSAAQPSLSHLYGQSDHAGSNDLTIAFLRSGSLMAALLVAMGVAVNKQAVIAWVGPEPFAGYAVTWMLGIAAWLLTVTNLGNHVLLAHGEIERPARAFLAYGIVKFTLAALFARWIGIATFPLAAIAATVLTYSPQVLRLTTTLLGVKRQGYWLYVEHVRPFAVCLSIAVGFWWLQPSFGTRWVAVGLGSVTVLILMLGGVAMLARQQTQDLCIAVAQGMAHWGISRRRFATSAKAFANFRTPKSVRRKVP